MLRFFRRIRQSLVSGGGTRKYLLYAMGEILLVMVGILMALRVNNWNSERLQGRQFEQHVEDLYNSVYSDISWQENSIFQTKTQEEIIQGLLINPDTLSSVLLAYTLFNLDYKSENYSSGTKFNLRNLIVNPNNPTQKEIAKQVTSYANIPIWSEGYTMNQFYNSKPLIYPFFERFNIPIPVLGYGIHFVREQDVDIHFFMESELVKIRSFFDMETFRVALRSTLSNKRSHREFLENSLEDGLSILQLIEKNYPDVLVRFDDVGILGDATPGDWERSTPMTLIDEKKSLWRVEIELDDGFVKFRSRDSWNENWGGGDFPRGETIFYGYNIAVENGRYEVLLNLTEKYYEFNRLD